MAWPLTKMESPITIPLHIVYVMDDSNTYDSEISKYCNNNSLRFTARAYNSVKYSDDRNNIEQLPAIHIYLERGYMNTLYPSEKIFSRIETYMNEYKARRRQQKKWKDTLLSLFKRFGRAAEVEPPKITMNLMH
jgi:hypothetical protein